MSWLASALGEFEHSPHAYGAAFVAIIGFILTLIQLQRVCGFSGKRSPQQLIENTQGIDRMARSGCREV